MSTGVDILKFLFPKELESFYFVQKNPHTMLVKARKKKTTEYCPKCAAPSNSTYDHRTVKIKDEPIRGKHIHLKITKRRLWCKTCQKPFTEPINKVQKSHRSTYNYKRGLCWAAENFPTLKAVKRKYQCSYSSLYKAVYEHLRKKVKEKINYDLPEKIGIDEHSIRKIKHREVDYATVIVDHSNKRIYDVIDDRTTEGLCQYSNKNFRGANNVKVVTIDLSTTYKSFVKKSFKNASIVADRFHVQRIINRAVNKLRLRIRGDLRKDPVRHLTLRNAKDLDAFETNALKKFLNLPENKDLKEAYQVKESLRRFYNTKGFKRAKFAFNSIINKCANSKVALLKSFSKTLMSWSKEILNYHRFNRISNGRVEGFNRKAKLVQRKAYGYKNFFNYRHALLFACI